jgi:hypothetical protein
MLRLQDDRRAEALLHVRFEGRSFDIPLGDLDIGAGSMDRDVKTAMARYMGISERDLRDYVIDRHETGNWTLRPEAIFG